MVEMECELLPNNKRLKQLIKEFGQVWIILSSKPKKMQCFDTKLGVHITSLNLKHNRNVRFPEDIIRRVK